MNTEKTLHNIWNLIFWYLVCWLIWFGILILFEFQLFGEKQLFKIAAWSLASVAGIVWTGLLFALLKTGRKIASDPSLKRAFKDDFMVLANQKASTFGFFSTVLFAAAMTPLGNFESLTGTVVAKLTILVGVSVYLGSWLFLLKRDDNNE